MGKDFRELLNEWQAPDPPPHLDAKVLASFERHRRRGVSKWTGPMLLPIPVFVLLIVLQLLSGGLLVRNFAYSRRAAPPVAIRERVVEVPVVKEKVVTQVVYLPAPSSDPIERRALYSASNRENDRPPMDLSGFRPVSTFQIRIVKGDTNER